MHELVLHIARILEKHAPEKLIIACSAGLDSTVLAHACHQLNYPLEIAHVNYQLRGAESNEDQQFLEDLALSLSVPIHVKKIDLKETLKHGGNLQDQAREVRYDFFQDLMKTRPNTSVLLAHHREDQTETFFMNLFRDSGIMGLAGIPEKRGAYLRPLLSISKKQLKMYAESNSVKWREDVSNASLSYTRNKWRNVLLPELRCDMDDLDTSVAVLTKVFQQTQASIETNINPIVARILQKQSLPVALFQSLNDFEGIELCRQLGQPFGILKTWQQLHRKGTFVSLEPNEKCPFNRLVFDGKNYSFLTDSPIVLPQIFVQRVASLPTSFSKETLYLDTEKLEGKLHIRRPKTGDRIHPIGMHGSRLISDVVSDAKLDSFQKQQLVVVADDQNILWVPKLAISRKAIASRTSISIVKVKLLFE